MTIPKFLIHDHEIGHYSGYRTTVYAQYFYEIVQESDLENIGIAYRFAKESHLPFLIIGGGTNLLFTQSRFSGVIIKNTLTGWDYDRAKKILSTYSNTPIWGIAESLETDYQNSIWHRFIGLPGSVGGAIYGNAGCFGLDTECNFIECTLYDMESGSRVVVSQAEMGFSYRHSMLKDHTKYFLVSAKFDMSKSIERYSSTVDNIDFRENKQPKGNSCGSFWKNPSREVSAGYLIESVGLKGHRHGGARWSDLHANFLLADTDCKPSDLIELVQMTHDLVKKKTGFDLSNEVRIIG